MTTSTNTTNITIDNSTTKEVEPTAAQAAIAYPTTNTNMGQLLIHGGVAGATIIILTFFMAVMMNKVTALVEQLAKAQNSKTDPKDSKQK